MGSIDVGSIDVGGVGGGGGGCSDGSGDGDRGFSVADDVSGISDISGISSGSYTILA